MEPQKPRCSYISPEGRACLGYATRGSDCCFFHDQRPEIVAKRENALKKGSKKANSHDGLHTWESRPLMSLSALNHALSELFNAGMAGDITTARLSALAAVANSLSKVIEGSDLEVRIKALEEQTAKGGRT